MGDEQASLLQEHLYLLHLSGYSPDLLVGGRGVARNDERWQYAVDLVHFSLASIGWNQRYPSNDYDGLIRGLVSNYLSNGQAISIR